MASIEEVKAAANGALERMREARGSVIASNDACDEISANTAHILTGSGREEASAAVSRIRSAGMNLEDATSNIGIAIEQLELLIAAL